MLVTSCGESSDDDVIVPGKEISVDDLPTITQQDLLDRMYLCYMGDLVLTDKKDIYRVVSEQAILETQALEGKVVSTRGIISGIINVEKFCLKLKNTQCARSAALVNLVYGENPQMTIDQLYDILKERCANHGIKSSYELRRALLAGECDSYSLQWYNDVYYFGEVDIPSPSSLAYMTAKDLVEDAVNIVMAAAPNDIQAWGGITNDVINSIAESISSKGLSLTNLSKAAIQAATRIIQINTEICDQDIIDELSSNMQSAIDEFIKTSKVGGPAQQALEQFISANFQELAIPNMLKKLYVWYCYPEGDVRYEYTFLDENKLECVAYDMSGKCVSYDYDGTWKLEDGMIKIRCLHNDKPFVHEGKAKLYESGEQVRVTIGDGDDKLVLRNTKDEAWGQIPNLSMFAGTYYANPYSSNAEYANSTFTVDVEKAQIVYDYGDRKEVYKITSFEKYFEGIDYNREPVSLSEKNQKTVCVKTVLMSEDGKELDAYPIYTYLAMTDDGLPRIYMNRHKKYFYYKKESLDIFKPSKLVGTYQGHTSDKYDFRYTITSKSVRCDRILRADSTKVENVSTIDPYEKVYTDLYIEEGLLAEVLGIACNNEKYSLPFVEYKIAYMSKGKEYFQSFYRCIDDETSIVGVAKDWSLDSNWYRYYK